MIATGAGVRLQATGSRPERWESPNDHLLPLPLASEVTVDQNGRAKRLASEGLPCYTGVMAKKINRRKELLGKTPASRLTAGRRNAPEQRLDRLYREIREILAAARNHAWQAVNTAMVEAYWDVGRAIVEEEQAGRQRADYGKHVIEGLSQRLREEFGKGYDRSNLFHMRAFFLACPKVDSLRRQLAWTHYRLVLRGQEIELARRLSSEVNSPE